MGFDTEMFARPRPDERIRYRAVSTIMNSFGPVERTDGRMKPADFPRVARIRAR